MLYALPSMIIIGLIGPWMMLSESAEIQIPYDDDAVSVKDIAFLDEKYCLVFPPTYCMDNEISDSNKSDLEIFREQFCPSKKMYICVDMFAQRCIPTRKKYREYMTAFMWQRVHLEEKELCTKAPYRQDHIKHLECLRMAKPLYENFCPVINYDQFTKDLATGNYNFDNYMTCLQQMVGIFCDQNTQSFLFEYLLIMNITYGYNPPKPDVVPGLRRYNFINP